MAKVISHRVQSKANSTFYWDKWSDVNTWAEWDDTLRSARLDGSFSLAAKGELTFSDGTTLPFEITDLDHGKEFEFTFFLPMAEMKVRRTIGARPDGCWIEQEVKFSGVLGFMASGKHSGRWETATPRSMDRLKKLIETGSL